MRQKIGAVRTQPLTLETASTHQESHNEVYPRARQATTFRPMPTCIAEQRRFTASTIKATAYRAAGVPPNPVGKNFCGMGAVGWNEGSTVAQKYIRVSRFSFLHSPSFVPRVSRSSSFVLRVSHFSFRPHLCLAFPVRPHLCFVFPISHSALIRASHFLFVLICASRFPFLIPPSFVPRISRLPEVRH